MSTVVGIDPSLVSCGIAILADGKPVLLKSVGHGTPNGRSYTHRSNRIVGQCRAVMRLIDEFNILSAHPDLAVIEGPAYGANMPSNHDRAGLWWGLYSTLNARDIPIAVVAPKTRALFATGSGNADKATVLAAVRAWWPDTLVRNHDIADAATLALLGAMHLGDQVPFDVRARHRGCVDVVKWPAGVGV